MSILSNLSSKKRTFEVAEPDRKYLAQGIFFIALGTILISCITVTELDLMPRYLLLAAGIILGIFGCFRLLKFHKDAKAFRDYEPAWDKGRGMYDRFAKEYNQWNEDETPPVSCDGDITYFLKLQQERLKEKGLHMENVSFREREILLVLPVSPTRVPGIPRIQLMKKSAISSLFPMLPANSIPVIPSRLCMKQLYTALTNSSFPLLPQPVQAVVPLIWFPI